MGLSVCLFAVAHLLCLSSDPCNPTLSGVCWIRFEHPLPSVGCESLWLSVYVKALHFAVGRSSKLRVDLYSCRGRFSALMDLLAASLRYGCDCCLSINATNASQEGG